MSIPEGAPYRISVFDKQGIKKDELTATFHCIWILNDIGKGYLTMATSDPKCTADNLQFGNYILFEHDELGNWGGPLAPNDQRRWNAASKQVTIPVLAAEYQFSRRYTGAGINIPGSAGTVFAELCARANIAEDALIRLNGAIWGGGDHSGVADTKNRMMSEIMKQQVTKAQVDWWFDPQQDTSGRLAFNAYLAQRRGSSNNYVLREGVNIETPDGDFYVEEGVLKNDVLVVGGAATNAIAAKGFSVDPTSIGQYGLWQSSEPSGSGQVGSVQSQADGVIAAASQPQKKFMLNALESPESPTTFKNIRVGDIVTVDLYSVGFYAKSFGVTENARVLSMEYSTDNNKVVVVTQVVNA